MNNNLGNGFSYSYSAKDQAEVKKIREKYVTDGENKLELLKKLDASVTVKGTLWSLIIGIAGALILGIGMCCVLVWGNNIAVFVLGIVIGVIGIVPIGFAYPVYIYFEKKERERIAPEIIRLTDELLK